jgi:hypothetical protein
MTKVQHSHHMLWLTVLAQAVDDIFTPRPGLASGERERTVQWVLSNPGKECSFVCGLANISYDQFRERTLSRLQGGRAR